MLLHAGELPAPHDIWRAWSFEPGVLAALGVTAVIYARGLHQSLARVKRSRALLVRESILFAAGFSTLAVALVSPIHAAGGVLFSAHMVQHELLMAIAAPLLVLGKPAVPLIWGFPGSMRIPAGRFFSSAVAQRSLSILTRPLVAFLLHAAAIWIWHAPAFYDASVTSEAVHGAQHLSFLGTAIVFWWSLFHSRQRRGREGSAIVYLFLTGIHTTLLGAVLTMAESPMYAVYSDALTQRWGLTLLEDQQLGGLIMWVPAGLVYLGAALYLLLGFLRQSTAHVARRDSIRAATVIVLVILAVACTDRETQWAAEMTGGTPSRGREVMRTYGCQSCHTIPGVTGASALVGPPLSGIGSRSYIAGVLSNTPAHMIEWLRNPPAVDSKTAMPNMSVTERDARDIAAYLYTLR